MENELSDILDNILGGLLLEGTYDIKDSEDGFSVMIETQDAGRLIGFKGEALSSLQLLVNQMLARKTCLPAGRAGEFKRVILDVAGWRKQKEEELLKQAKTWAEEVSESGKDMELEPMPSWQRRIIHMVVGEVDGVESESIGEGRDRHMVIKKIEKA